MTVRIATSPAAAFAFFAIATTGITAPVQTTWLWHLHQPIYWNGKRATAPDRYEVAWDTIAAKIGGRSYPFDDVSGIFGVDDREAAYQYRVRDSIQTLLGHTNAGAQLTYSGSLIENVDSLSGNQASYFAGWQNSFIQAHGWTTSGAYPRLDIVNFTFHHSLGPLQTSKTVEMELRLMRRKMEQRWGLSTAQLSRGYFPTEMAFSEHLIPLLKAQGIDWSIVSGNHISRACADFPLQFGSGGENCQPPNLADVQNTTQTNYYRQTISRGCAPANASPLAYTPQQAQWVNPNTGVVEKLVVVPAAQEFGWVDGYQSFGAGQLSPVTPFNDPARPMLVLLAHDGDNAYGGGFSYYMNDVQNFASSAVSAGYGPTTIQQYLASYPVPSSAVVHVEDGPWVNADGDFGSPTFINWNYPLLDSSGQIDPVNGWHEKPREYAVMLAAENRVRTAERVSGVAPDLDQILSPGASTSPVERAWHYYLGSLDSGNVYYGTPGDMEIKATVGCNEAVTNANLVLGSSFTDLTEPSIWLPQRWPYNPGAVNFGVETGYVQKTLGPDFTVWTFVSDASGLGSVSLKWRVDGDGQNPIASTQNETFAGGAEVGAWQSTAMNLRAFPKTNIYNKSGIDYSVLPTYIADHASAAITGQAGKLLDYYVEAVDSQGNTARSVIQHVYVGTLTGSGGGGGGGQRMTVIPATPVAGQQAMMQYNPVGGPISSAVTVKLHYGINNWAAVSPDLTMLWNSTSARWETTVTISASATQLDAVTNDGGSNWDNNGGADWHFSVTAGVPPPTSPWTLDGIAESNAMLRADNPSGLKLWASQFGNLLYVATNGASSSRDHFILIGNDAASSHTAMWAKGGSVLTWKTFLADEVDNSFSGWFDAAQAQALSAMTAKADGGATGVIEGTVDLAQLYGSQAAIPPTLYIAAVAYGTADASVLVSAVQAPATTNGNGNVDPGEYHGFAAAVPVHVSYFSAE
ncbi:MAG: hypothetical protein ACR2IE_10220 [Candidatus Sumerlaeaceae bacterium]